MNHPHPQITPLRSYRCYQHPFIQLKATTAEDAARKAALVGRLPVVSVERRDDAAALA